MTRARICLIAIVGCAGCAANDGIPETLVPDYYAGNKRPDPVSLDGCVWIVDSRSRDNFHGYVIPSDALLEWLGDGVEAELNTSAVPRGEAPEDDAYISVEKAYMSHLSTSISGVVVLEVGDGVNSRAVRGRVTRMNWWGAKSEYSSLMSDALDDALLNVAPESARSTGCTAPK